MGKFIDLTGQRFGKLTVIERAENKNGRTCYKCLCDRGTQCIVTAHDLRNGDTQSCGCLHKEQLIKRNKNQATHNKRNTRIYTTWSKMKYRCLNPNCKAYPDYGGRGIKIYPAWIDNFQAFYDYVSKLEHFNEKGYSLDRIDNNGNYEPNNLRFANQKTQLRNTRVNHLVEYQGEKMTLAEASEKSGIGYTTLQNRLKRGDKKDRLFRAIEPRKS